MINKVILVGNVGNDPEVRHLNDGLSVARISLATSEYYTDKTGKQVTQTEWHRVVAWRHLAKLAEQYIRKGSQLYIEGKISTTQYDKNGETRYSTEIVASEIRLLGRRDSNSSSNDEYRSAPAAAVQDGGNNYRQSAPSTPQSTAPAFDAAPMPEDDLPF